MTPTSLRQPLPPAQRLTQRALSAFEHFTHVQASSGMVLLLASVVALIWANSAFSTSYVALWHLELGISFAGATIAQPLHFWINDGVMTLFFLVVGMEVRHEIHAGSLSRLREASLPVFAALGGVLVPALVFLAFNHEAPQRAGWAVPTATDIAFAVGLLALLGRSIPHQVRVFLLALAVIDDLVAVLIIAVFYSGGLDAAGLPWIALALALVLLLQHLGVNRALVYVLPGLLLWWGVLVLGAHPTLAGVMLGLMTPVEPLRRRIPPMALIKRYGWQVLRRQDGEPQAWVEPLRKLKRAQRDLLPPTIRIQALLHPWVAFLVMPLFALANAGISLQGLDWGNSVATGVTVGVAVALAAGKPVGILLTCWLAIRVGWGRLPEGMSWQGLVLVGLFAGVGFTMSIFIALLAFDGEMLLNATKLGVLLGSVVAACLGMGWGWLCFRRTGR